MKKIKVEDKLKLLVAEDYFTTYAVEGIVPKISVADGPCGLRKRRDPNVETATPANCYPSPHVLANSWDRAAVKNVGKAIAADCAEMNEDIILAPGVNIKRTPLCGRNFEYFSEDPYLTGILATEYVKGLQESNVGACVKHFCANNREHDRLYQTSEVDKRTLREIYTKAFEMIIQDVKPYMIMGSYNPVNGINASENKWLLDGILRKELGYDGVIVSDWEAVHDRAKALKAGVDIAFPFREKDEKRLREAYEQGEISEADMDESIARILALSAQIEKDRKLRKPLSEERRHEISLTAARNGIVLLKNEGNVLPLKGGKLAFVGDQMRYVGGGAAQVLTKNEYRSLATEVSERLPNASVEKYFLFMHGMSSPFPKGVRIADIPRAMDIAYDADVTILTVGTDDIIETEGYDRTSLKLPAGIEDIILKVASRANKLVVVLEAGAAVDMTAWIDKVDAVVYAGFGGDTMNEAIADILTGKVCPSGKLSETFPLCIEDTPTGTYMGDGYAERYEEGVFVGYRYYEAKNIPVLFPFGYGLSYAKFEYSNFQVQKKGNMEYEISFTIKNVSDVDGAEIPQLYVRNVDKTVTRPEKELRRFERVELKAGEEKRVSFVTDKDCFAYFNVCYNDWHVDGGRYEFWVCRDINTVEFKEKIIVE